MCLTIVFMQIVYLPSSPVPELRSFSAPVLSLHDTQVTAPFFGPNVWRATLQPVSGGGIPSGNAPVELKMTFKDGGAFDFHSHFERIAERLRQAMDVARENGFTGVDGSNVTGVRGAGPLTGTDMGTIDLEQLPAYEEARASGSTVLASPVIPTMAPEREPVQQDIEGPVSIGDGANNIETPRHMIGEPLEPPPGYEEVQRLTVASQLESRVQVE